MFRVTGRLSSRDRSLKAGYQDIVLLAKRLWLDINDKFRQVRVNVYCVRSAVVFRHRETI